MSAPFANHQYEIYLRGWPGSPGDHHRPGPAGGGGRDALRPRPTATCRRRGQRRTAAGEPRRVRPLAHRAADAARHRRARPVAARCSARRCPRRCCWRRSACSRWSTPTASWRRRGRPRALGLPFMHSARLVHPLEQVAEALGDAPRWFQLYWPNERDAGRSLVGRAEPPATGAGRDAGHVTAGLAADATWQLAYLPFLTGRASPTTSPTRPSAPRCRSRREEDLRRRCCHWAGVFSNPALTWDDLALLREQTAPADRAQGHPAPRRRARGACEHGVDGIIVSNHGGRQVDGAIAVAGRAAGDASRRSASHRRCCSTAASAPARTC